MKVTLDLPDFVGFEPTGEFRCAEKGEYYYASFCPYALVQANDKTVCLFPIYRKVYNPEVEAAKYSLTITPADIYSPDILKKIDWSRKYQFAKTKYGDRYVSSGNGNNYSATSTPEFGMFRLILENRNE
jgi:hypothetical protein